MFNHLYDLKFFQTRCKAVFMHILSLKFYKTIDVMNHLLIFIISSAIYLNYSKTIIIPIHEIIEI